MGIPYYFYVITQRHPGILTSKPNRPCGQFFLDFNGAIHPAAQQVLRAATASAASAASAASLEKSILANIWKYFLELVNAVQPQNGICICIDGVAPRAKMLQQRKRRFLSAFRSAELARIGAATAAAAWDTNAITPGTNFMKRLHASLRAYIRHQAKAPGALGNIKLSTSDEAGEGEHKIFQQLALHPPDDDAPVVIYGLDADLIMLSLLSHRPNLYLFREVTHVKKGTAGATGDEPAFTYLNVDALRRGLLSDLVTRWAWNANGSVVEDPYGPEATQLIENYATMCFFLGNDFIPHLLTVHLKKNGHEHLLAAARDVWNAEGPWIAADGSMDMHKFAAILSALAPSEDATVHALVEDYVKKKSWAQEEVERLDTYPLQPQHKDPLANVLMYESIGKWQPHYYKHMFGMRMHDNGIVVRACELYWQGIQWTWAYYTRRPRDPTWFYPFAYAPSIRDLTTNTLPDGTPTSDQAACLEPASSPAHAVEPVIQLLSVLPRQSRALLPEAVQPLMDNPVHGCTYLYPERFALRTFLRTHLWECDPVLPHFNVPLLQRAAAKAMGNVGI